MPFTYDLATDRGRVRLLVTDVDQTQPLFQDDEIDAFLAIEGGSVPRAAALALDTIASNESLVQKASRLVDFQTNGPAVAADLRAHAAALRARADELDAAASGGAFDWAEIVTGAFGARERVVDEWLRAGA